MAMTISHAPAPPEPSIWFGQSTMILREWIQAVHVWGDYHDRHAHDFAPCQGCVGCGLCNCCTQESDAPVHHGVTACTGC